MALTAAFRKTLAAPEAGAAFALTAELRLEPGCTVLLGPSGSGKTTLLRCLAGLERPDEGRVSLDAEVWFDAALRLHLPPQRRRVGVVFSDYALFPRMSVRANLAFAGADAGRVSALLERFELSHLADSMPPLLSAGQQQRVALARALASGPRLLLMDEPFSALDAPLRARLQEALLPMLAELGLPVLWVTHDREEACRVGDSLVLLDQGRVIGRGLPSDLLDRPGTSRAADLLGLRNRFAGHRLAPDLLQWGSWRLEVLPGPTYASWGIAAERVRVGDEGPNGVRGIVRAVRPSVQGQWLRVEVPGAGTIEVVHGFQDGGRPSVTEGAEIGLRLPKAAIFPLDS